VVLQSSEAGDESTAAAAAAADEDREAETASSECESVMPSTSSTDVAVLASEQSLVCGSPGLSAENCSVSGEMCLPVKALVKRGKKSLKEDQTLRYPAITGTLSERCVQSIQHIVQVIC